MSLDPDRWEADGLLDPNGMSLAEARQTDAAAWRTCSSRR